MLELITQRNQAKNYKQFGNLWQKNPENFIAKS